MRSAFTSPTTVAQGVEVMSWKRRLTKIDCAKRTGMMKFIPKDQPRSIRKIKFLDQLTDLRECTLPTNLKDFAISTTLPHSESAVKEGFYMSGNSGDEALQGLLPRGEACSSMIELMQIGRWPETYRARGVESPG